MGCYRTPLLPPEDIVLYNHDSNAILAEPLTSRNKHELIRSTRVLHAYLSDRGLTPQYQMLENECPGGLKTFLRKGKCQVSTRAPIPASHQRCRTSNPNLQGSPHFRPEQLQPKLPFAYLGPPHPTCHPDTQPPPPFPYQPKTVDRSPAKRCFLFQPHTTRTSRHASHSTQDTHQLPHLVLPRCIWMVPRTHP